MNQKEIITKENIFVCSVRWGNYNPNCGNGFYPFELQWLETGLNYKCFVYDRDPETERRYIDDYGPMGEYIFYKIISLRKSLIDIIDKGIVKYILFCDYTDTMLISSADELISKLNDFEKKTILGSEKNQFPFKVTVDNWNLDVDLGPGPYLNSGVILSEAKNFLKILGDCENLLKNKKTNYASDQGIWQIMYYFGKHDIELDKQSIVFFNMHATYKDEDYSIVDGRLVMKNGNMPCIIHQNGPWSVDTGLIKLFGETKKFKSYFDDKMLNKFIRLRNEGFKPKTVLDIGAWHGHWSKSFMSIFPYSNLFLFEANPVNEEYLKKTNLKYFKKLLWRYSGVEKDFFTLPEQMAHFNTGSSLYIENTSVYNEKTTVIKKLKTDTLDNVIKQNNISDINFIKIDVQGSELDIFEGAQKMFKNNFIEFILIELSLREYNKGTPDFFQYLNYMEKKGFYPFDIFEIHEWENRVFQFDVLFVNRYSEFYNLLKK